MNFKELRKGFPVYILNKESVEFNQGKVTQDSTPPRLSAVFGQPMVCDVAIESKGTTKIWTLPADQKVAEMQTDNNVIISTDNVAILAMIKNIAQECETYLQGIEHIQDKLQRAKELISKYDITYKQQQQTEERFNKLEHSISGIENVLSEILQKL